MGGWTASDDGACEAPAMNVGSCGSHVKMTDEAFKAEFGLRCGVRWPCKKTCEDDYRERCPTGWRLIDDVCVSLDTYTGPCVPFAYLAQANAREKQTYAELCQVDFCGRVEKTETEQCDFDASVCPIGWSHVGGEVGYCHGFQYQGPCRPLISLSDLGDIGKARFIKQCGVKFACKREASHRHASGEPSTLPSAAPVGPISSDGRLFAV